MDFYKTSDKSGLVDDVLFRTNTTTTEFPLTHITRYINEGYSRVANIIIQADGRMQWDDINHTDQPVSQTDIVENTVDYNVFQSAPSALQDWLTIDKVEMLDSNGYGMEILPIDKKDLTTYEEETRTPSTPYKYDFNGTSILLYPKPNYSYTKGLVIYFHRAPSYFASTDTTKRPGFATIFHPYLSIYASHQWNSIKKNDFNLQPQLDKIEREIGLFYSKRPKYEVPKLTRAKENYK